MTVDCSVREKTLAHLDKKKKKKKEKKKTKKMQNTKKGENHLAYSYCCWSSSPDATRKPINRLADNHSGFMVTTDYQVVQGGIYHITDVALFHCWREKKSSEYLLFLSHGSDAAMRKALSIM